MENEWETGIRQFTHLRTARVCLGFKQSCYGILAGFEWTYSKSEQRRKMEQVHHYMRKRQKNTIVNHMEQMEPKSNKTPGNSFLCHDSRAIPGNHFSILAIINFFLESQSLLKVKGVHCQKT